LRQYLKRAAEDGHDWKALLREEAKHRPPSLPPLPPEEWLDPNNPSQ
jgi:hypothetical protein